MGNIVMPKQSADKAEMEAVLSVYVKHDNWIENSVLISELKNLIGDSLENQAYTKKVQIPAYFGFVEWENPASKTSKKRITERGKRFYQTLISKRQNEINEEIIKALEELNFGRNVHGCSSDSNIEPPKVFIKSCIFLDYLTRKEYGYVLWQMDIHEKNLLELLSEIKSNRLKDIYIYNTTPNKYNDAKPITVLYNWGFLKSDGNVSGQEKIKLSENLIKNDIERLLKLKVQNNLTTTERIENEIGKDSINETDADYKLTKANSKIVQKIYFGAPGTGKSHQADIDTAGKKVKKTTFHPESDYTSFVGSYKPSMENNNIVYQFSPQIFTKLYIEAWTNLTSPNITQQYYLQIEEINRGNCAEIFGDLFQLLDRDEKGFSKYKITAEQDLLEFLKDKNGFNDPNHEGIKKGELRLPSNFNIVATMNTSDQSLFPMDSAFKRRWDWQYIPINTKCEYSDFIIKLDNGKEYKWLLFLKKINKEIFEVTQSQDKQIGNWFINAKLTENIISEDTFINKVVFYLWNDVFKEENNTFFKTEEEEKEKELTYNSFFEVENTSNLLSTIFENRLNLTSISNPKSTETSTEEE